MAAVLTRLLFPEVPGLRVDRVWRESQIVHVAAHLLRRAARCPLCRRRSKRVRSAYERTLADLPCCGQQVVVHLHTRRFACRVPWCPRRIFAEQVPALTAPHARRTVRLRTRLEQTAFDLGGAAGARHARVEGMPVSGRTLVRLIRAAPCPEAGVVRVVGIDDWARRRGRTYGTILVNLETHQVIDLLPERTAEVVAAWLRTHPEVEIVSRDRAGAYADAARQGAPQASQIADRFHLQKNVTEALERYLKRKHAALRQAAQSPPSLPPSEDGEGEGGPAVLFLARPTRAQQEQALHRARRLARYEEVMALQTEGYSLRAIARQTGLALGTVHRYVRTEGFPEIARRRPRTTLLTPYLPYLHERWGAGCHNAKALFGEIRAQGFTGGRTCVAAHLQGWRSRPLRQERARGSRTAPASAPGETGYSARQTCWLLLKDTATLEADEQAYLTRLLRACPQIAVAQALVKEFATVFDEHDVAGLYSWLKGAAISGIADLAAVAQGMWLDRAAILAAVTSPWSQGQVEGHVNRLKVLKRQGYGRCGFDLLRRRVLRRAS